MSRPLLESKYFSKDRIAALEAENRRLSADALWAATHRSELADLRQAFERSEAENRRLREALNTVSLIAGNLPDETLEDRTGPNDARARGMMVTEARRVARTALNGGNDEGTN